MEVKWTEEQREAITTRGKNVLVAAAAGSGKTAVLVERIINIVTDPEKPVDIDRLLVVTFTNAAASEMRERIAERLISLLDQHPEDKRLADQLTLLNKATITTIHSFCLDVVRKHFFLLDLDPSFRVGDDTETLLLKLEAMEELFEELYEKNDEGFLLLVESYGGTKGDQYLQDVLLKLYGFIRSLPWPEKWLNDVLEAFEVKEDFSFEDSKWAEVILDSIKVEILGLLNGMSVAIEKLREERGLEGYLSLFQSEAHHLKELIDSKSWNEFKKKIEAISFERLPKASKEADAEVKEEVRKLREDVKKRIREIRDKFFIDEEEEIKREIKKLYPVMKALADLILMFDKKYGEKKKEKGVIDFEDIEHFALKILSNEEVVSYYREKFEEIFIDEYQDSSLIQEAILSLIARDNPPNRFMVGDVKQSIYRFRQANPYIFFEKYTSYSQEGENKKILLYKNFRSRKEIIDAVNYIFEKIMSKNIGEVDYSEEEKLNYGANYESNPFEKENERTVEVHLIEREREEEFEEDKEILDDMQVEAHVVGERIKGLFREGFKVYDKEIGGYRPVEYRDICVLLRATEKWAYAFEEEFVKMGIPVFADTNAGYFDTAEIKTMLSLLQVIDNPMQDIPLLAVLRSPIFSFTEEELVDIRLEDADGTIYEALKKASLREDELGEKVRNFLDSLKRWQEKSIYMPVDEFLWYLYEETGFYSYVGAMPQGVERQANLRVLFERAKEYEETSFKGLFNFVNFINRLRTTSTDMGSAKTVGENENVVRVMSIHKSKGLEFPIVIVAGLGKQFNTKDLNEKILYHHFLGIGPEFVDYRRRLSYPSIVKEAIKYKIKLESLSEEMRVLYVALTRAKEKLILVASVKDIKERAKKWGKAKLLGKKISEYDVLKSRSYIDWIGSALIRHRDLKLLREFAEISPELEQDSSKWEVKIWNKRDVIIERKKDEGIEVLERLNALNLEGLHTEFRKEVEERLNYVYPYDRSSKLPAKLSVTEIKRILNDEVIDEETTSIFERRVLKTPLFLEKKRGLTPAERGIAMHLVMQKLDLSKDLSYRGIKEQIKDMVKNEILTEEQAKEVDANKIERFFKTPLGKRLLKAKEVRREVPFHIKISSREIYRDLPEVYQEEFIAVQGIIDCFFEEEGELVLIDYKTDYVENGKIEEIRDKYRVQIDLYGKALEEITGKKVKEKYIYLFFNDTIIKY
ncbi:helicase-exonuclease AddAB subunit AddA [Caldanaerobacter subterraneus KAk]|uniref:helicase-exonuclease AddAB subunit AddA n=1 Tax=Caldanaerobacter subterraneus TaxID=911092 RepID=UPI0032C18774